MNSATAELTISLPGGEPDALIALLAEAGFEGFWEDGTALRAYIGEDRWTDQTRETVREALAVFAAGRGISLPDTSVQIIPPQNWNAQWEASIQPVHATERIIIAPSWHPVAPAPDQIVLTIDPKMSFGTGHHETTRLVLQLMEPRLRPGSRVLDLGTGTGILAIAAVKLGAGSALGIDNDEWSIANARENVAANGVAGRITVLQGEMDAAGAERFDLILANIQRSVLEPLLPALAGALLPHGMLILAGLLTEERAQMRRGFVAAHLHVEEERTEAEWTAFALTPALRS